MIKVGTIAKKQQHLIDEDLKVRLESIIKKIASLEKVIKKVDKPSWRRVNGYLNTSNMKVIGYIGVKFDDALEYCEELETNLDLASQNARFNRHKDKFKSISTEVMALKLAIKLTV